MDDSIQEDEHEIDEAEGGEADVDAEVEGQMEADGDESSPKKRAISSSGGEVCERLPFLFT